MKRKEDSRIQSARGEFRILETLMLRSCIVQNDCERTVSFAVPYMRCRDCSLGTWNEPEREPEIHFRWVSEIFMTNKDFLVCSPCKTRFLKERFLSITMSRYLTVSARLLALNVQIRVTDVVSWGDENVRIPAKYFGHKARGCLENAVGSKPDKLFWLNYVYFTSFVVLD